MTSFARPGGLDEAIELLAHGDALALAGGSDVVPLVRRGKRHPADARRHPPPPAARHRARRGRPPHRRRTTLAAIERDPRIAGGYAALHQAAAAAAAPQLRNVGTLGGNLAQAVRCWYYRHPDLTCWLNGGDTCYAQIGDHRKHGLEPGDCISVAPSDLAAPLAALGAHVALRGPRASARSPLLDLYARPDDAPAHGAAPRAGRADRLAPAARAARRLALRARRRACGVVVRPRRRRGRAQGLGAAPRRDRRHERAARARPGRPAARSRRARRRRAGSGGCSGRSRHARSQPPLPDVRHTEPATASGSGVGPNCGY